jgi:hypothetical protein
LGESVIDCASSKYLGFILQIDNELLGCDYDGSINDKLPLLVLLEAADVVGIGAIGPLAVSRQFVTTLCVRPSDDLFAVFIQLIEEQ